MNLKVKVIGQNPRKNSKFDLNFQNWICYCLNCPKYSDKVSLKLKTSKCVFGAFEYRGRLITMSRKTREFSSSVVMHSNDDLTLTPSKIKEFLTPLFSPKKLSDSDITQDLGIFDRPYVITHFNGNSKLASRWAKEFLQFFLLSVTSLADVS